MTIKFNEFCQLIEQIHCLSTFPLQINYLDKDGELLSINNDTIIEHILRVHTGLLRILIQRKDLINVSNRKLIHSTDQSGGRDSLRKRKKILIESQRQIELQTDFRLVSSIIDVELLPTSYRRVRLHRYKESKPLGFYIRDGIAIKYHLDGVENVPGVFISRLLSGGLAESTGLLSVGDEIVEVNGIEVTGKTLDQVTDMMIANSHNLILTVRPQNDSYNLQSNITVTNRTCNSLQSQDSTRIEMERVPCVFRL